MEELAIMGGSPASPYKISLVKPKFSDKDADDIAKVLESGFVRMGPFTKQFEEEFAARVGAKYAYAVCNGTAALHCAYLSLLKPGYEVIAPSFTFIATISTIIYSNAKPILTDVDPDTFLLDPEKVKEKITNKTKAIAPVHLFGNSCDMKAIVEIAKDHRLKIINDCAQAHGTEYNGVNLGSWPDLSCYSFYSTKTLITGEGGMVTTNDSDLHRLGSLIRSHGDDGRYHHVELGLNYRFTDIMAIIGLNQLTQLDDLLLKRRHNGEFLRKKIEKLESLKSQKITPGTNPSYSYFSVVLNPEKLSCSRDELINALQYENIECSVHYPMPLNKQPVVERLLGQVSCPISENLSKWILSLPMHPYLTENDMNYIVKAVEKVSTYYHKG